MTQDKAMQLALADYRRSVIEGMGLFMIAESWGIEPRQVVRHKDGYGLLTEGFVLAEMAGQIMEMDLEQNTLAAEVLYLSGISREIDGDVGDIGQRQAGVRQ
jgi:hypothetical protein